METFKLAWPSTNTLTYHKYKSLHFSGIYIDESGFQKTINIKIGRTVHKATKRIPFDSYGAYIQVKKGNRSFSKTIMEFTSIEDMEIAERKAIGLVINTLSKFCNEVYEEDRRIIKEGKYENKQERDASYSNRKWVRH